MRLRENEPNSDMLNPLKLKRSRSPDCNLCSPGWSKGWDKQDRLTVKGAELNSPQTPTTRVCSLMVCFQRVSTITGSLPRGWKEPRPPCFTSEWSGRSVALKRAQYGDFPLGLFVCSGMDWWPVQALFWSQGWTWCDLASLTSHLHGASRLIFNSTCQQRVPWLSVGNFTKLEMSNRASLSETKREWTNYNIGHTDGK